MCYNSGVLVVTSIPLLTVLLLSSKVSDLADEVSYSMHIASN